MDERTKTLDSIVRNKAAGERWAWDAVSAAYDAGASAAFNGAAFTPMMNEAIYAAWHGAGDDISGGDWARFAGMLPRA